MNLFYRYMMSNVISMTFVAVSSSHSFAADSLDLQQAVREAIQNSPKIKQSQNLSESSRWKKMEAMSGHLPNLTATGNYVTNKKYALTDVLLPGASGTISIPQIIPTTTMALNAQVPLFDGFATTNRVSAANRFQESSENDVEWQKFQLEREVTLAFYRAVALEQLYAVAQQNLRTLEDHLRDIRLFKSAGLSTHYDVLRVEVQASEARSEVMNAEDNMQMARSHLAELMGKDSDARVPKGQLPNVGRATLTTVNQVGEGKRKDFEAMELRLEGLDKLTAAARNHWSPKFSLFGQYQYYNNLNDSPTDRSAFRNTYTAGVAMTWILFDGLSSSAKVRESAAERRDVAYSLEQRKLHARHEIEFWRRKLSYYLTLFDSKTNEVGKSQESVRLAQVGLKAGTRTNSDLLDAESELFRAKASVVNAQLGSIESVVNLELATGKPIYKF